MPGQANDIVAYPVSEVRRIYELCKSILMGVSLSEGKGDKEGKEADKVSKLSTYEIGEDGNYREKPNRQITDSDMQSSRHTETDSSDNREVYSEVYEAKTTYRREVILKSVSAPNKIVYGVVMEPTGDGVVKNDKFVGSVSDVDCYDHFTTEAEISAAMISFMEDLAKGSSGRYDVNHDHEADVPVAVIENWQAKEDTSLNGAAIKKGSWIQGIKVYDDNLWAAISKGEITGLSIEGRAFLADTV